jgi:hypothetical protein
MQLMFESRREPRVCMACEACEVSGKEESACDNVVILLYMELCLITWLDSPSTFSVSYPYQKIQPPLPFSNPCATLGEHYPV